MKHKSNKGGAYPLLKKFQGKDFSEVEDSPNAFEIISEIGSLAGQGAVAEAIAAGLPRVFIRNNEIIRLLPDGTEEIITGPDFKGRKFYYSYKPGTVLHLRKK
jgi:hypothetical protein